MRAAVIALVVCVACAWAHGARAQDAALQLAAPPVSPRAPRFDLHVTTDDQRADAKARAASAAYVGGTLCLLGGSGLAAAAWGIAAQMSTSAGYGAAFADLLHVMLGAIVGVLAGITVVFGVVLFGLAIAADVRSHDLREAARASRLEEGDAGLVVLERSF